MDHHCLQRTNPFGNFNKNLLNQSLELKMTFVTDITPHVDTRMNVRRKSRYMLDQLLYLMLMRSLPACQHFIQS